MTPATSSKPWHCSSEAFAQIGAALQGQGSSSYHIVTAPPDETQRIAEWYQHCPVPGLTLKRVEIIHNPQMTRLFEGRIALLEQRHENPSFQPRWMAESTTDAERKQRGEVLALLGKKAHPFKDPDHPHVTIVPLWHGTKKEILSSLFKTGFANLATTDSGFFGKGIYNAGEAEYAYRVYSQGALLINWVAIYSAFPVLRDDMKHLTGKGNYQNYDGHFIPVVPEDPHNPHEVNYYPCKPGEKHIYTELVVFESAQVLPRYLVELQPELPASPLGMGAASASTFTAGELLDILFQLLDDPQIQKHTDLCQRLQAKADVLLELPESTPLEAEEAKLFRLVKRLLTQGKVNNAVLNSILKSIPTPLSAPSALIQHPFSKQPPQLQGYNTIASGLIPPQAGLPSPSSFVMQGNTQWVQPSQTPIPSASTMQSLQQQGPIGPGGFFLPPSTSQHNIQEVKLPPASTVAADGLPAGSLALYDWTVQPILETVIEGSNSFIQLQDGTLATPSNDNTIKLWRQDGTCLQILKGHQHSITKVIELKDGTLVSGDMGNTINLWKRDGTCLQTIQLKTLVADSWGSNKNIIELKDGVLAFELGHNIELWKRDGTCLQIIEGGAPIGIELKNGTHASILGDYTIKLWKRDGTCLQILRGHTRPIYTLIELEDGRLASGSSDGIIKLWGLDGTCLQTLQAHTGTVSALIQLKDGTLASCSTDQTIKLWGLNGFVKTLKGHTSEITSLVELRDGTLASASLAYTIKLWNRDGTCLQTIETASFPWHLTQLQDGTLAASVGNTIQLWKFPLKQ